MAARKPPLVCLAPLVAALVACSGAQGTPDAAGGAQAAGGTDSSGSAPGELELRVFLEPFTPGVAHEARPHGVPASYDWSARVAAPRLTPPAGETVANWWGQLYVDETGVIAEDARVEVADVTFLALAEGSDEWTVVQDAPGISGGAWAEDFQSVCPASAYDSRPEPGGGVSFRTAPDCNAHYWPQIGQSALPYDALRAVLVVGFTRLTPEAPGAAGALTASYLNGLGADWRVPGGSCPTPPGSQAPVCSPIGGGKFIVVTSSWRTMVMHSMSREQLAELPLPDVALFAQPDGRYFQ